MIRASLISEREQTNPLAVSKLTAFHLQCVWEFFPRIFLRIKRRGARSEAFPLLEWHAAYFRIPGGATKMPMPALDRDAEFPTFMNCPGAACHVLPAYGRDRPRACHHYF
jgi:hypothetical protein